MNPQFKRALSALFIFAAIALFLGTAVVVRSRYEFQIPTGLGPGTLNRTNVAPGKPVKPGTKLRILPLGDSITYGWLSQGQTGDDNGYRLQLREDLSADEVVFAGTEVHGTMDDGWFAAWPGKTIKYMADNIAESLKQRPNLVLIHAGTNDVDIRPNRSKEGNDAKGVAERLGSLVDQVLEACPDAVVIVAVILPLCDKNKAPLSEAYRALIPEVAQKRRDAGHHVLAADFRSFPTADLPDCIHPSMDGYRLMGHFWYDFITQIPTDWIGQPVGPDPVRPGRE